MTVKTAEPLQVYLNPVQDRVLRYLAKRDKMSLAELIRRSIDFYLSQIPLDDDPALDIIGLGASNVGDLAEEHDRYLAALAREE